MSSFIKSYSVVVSHPPSQYISGRLFTTPHFTTSTTSLYKYNSTTDNYEPCNDQAKLAPFTTIDVVDWKEGWFEILGGYFIPEKNVALYKRGVWRFRG